MIAGVTIGRYSVIGAGSVVTKDVNDYSIYAGNPAKKIRQFETLDQIRKYFRSKQPLSGPITMQNNAE